MSRFLFVVPPLTGHVNPARSVADRLQADGHQVAWTGSLATLRPMLGEQAVIYRTGSRIHRAQADQGLASIRSLWQEFIVPYTKFILPAVDKAIADFGPDVLVCDQHTPAGALLAHRYGLPWATLACSTIELLRPYRQLPPVEGWIDDRLAQLRAMAGVSEPIDPLFSPELVLSFTSAELTGPIPMDALRQVGACFADRADDPDFDFSALDPDRALVLVTMGTLAAELADDFYARAVAALAPLADRVQAIVLARPDEIPEPPPNVLLTARVPVLRLLPRLAAVLCHGGLNTVCESLAFGVPLVVAPIRHDQPLNASLVTAAGAGRRVHFSRAQPAELRAALLSVLDDPGYRTAAGRLAESFTAAGGAPAAAHHLQRLATAMSRPSRSDRPQLTGPRHV
ncbi:MAG TPA: glycosyltransferase [Jatrophihabitans sp.]|nr:glycosyltransferase [Jatrophihabitans sp.]